MAGKEASASIISLPKGGGALSGLGEKFSPDLHTGTGNFTIPISLPAGRGGFQPALSLSYSTGNGNGTFALGWSLSVPGVARKTSKGIPRYRDAATHLKDRDVFLLSGAEDLVELGSFTDEAGIKAVRYRPRTEGLFAEILRYRNAAGSDYWRVRSKDGLVSYYGTNPDAGEHPQYPQPAPAELDPAVVTKPDRAQDIFRWHLTLTKDPFGNRIEYLYAKDSGSEAARRWKQPLLKSIRYADYGTRTNPSFLVTVTFEYEDRADTFSEYRSGFEIRTSKRCKSILIETHADADYKVRRYEFEYQQSGANGLSLLTRVNIVGFDDAGTEARELPPLDFGYSAFRPEDQKRRDFFPVRGELPSSSLANPNLELVDLFGNALPDILEMNGVVRYWRNLGNGRFDTPRPMADAPAGLALADAGVQLLDADGDGRTDLMITQPALSGYFPLRFGAKWDPRSLQRYRAAPPFSLEDPEVRLLDLTGDGVTDAIRSGARLECFFNDAEEGWNETRAVERRALEAFPNINFSDPRVKWNDMSGDGLMDIVLVHDRNVEYWPNLGYGDWGRRVAMRNAPRFPFGYDPRRILLGDVDGDGLADIVYVDDRQIRLWINRSGNGWSEEIVIPGTAPVSDMDAVRLTDLLGSGVGGILWSKDARTSTEDHYFFLDLTGGTKPYVLNEMNSNTGAATKVGYAPSTRYYLEDQKRRATHWKTPLPIPVQVVAQVEIIDELSQGKLTTEYRYHDGYRDGLEGEFRGFGFVEQLDSESFDKYASAGLHGQATTLAVIDREYFSPPTLTKSWFHQGAIEDEESGWSESYPERDYWQGDRHLLNHSGGVRESLSALARKYSGLPSRERRRITRDALRALRGNVLRTELYALDGSSRELRPYTVTESAYDVREESPPAPSGAQRPHIFFPHLKAQRTTEWERGDDPLTRMTCSREYDGFGNLLTQIDVACPRGWRRMDDAIREATYLATITRTAIAVPMNPNVYIHDRVSHVATYEILNPPVANAANAIGRTVADISSLALSAANLAVVRESLMFYDGDPAVSDRLAYQGLPFGIVGQFGAVTRSETLALTDAILNSAYGAARPPYLTPGGAAVPNAEYPAAFVQRLATRGGYVFHPGGAPYAGGYYVTSSRRRFDFHGTGTIRGLVLERRDPMGAATRIEYDQPCQLLPAATMDAAGLRTRAEFNYRVMQPQLLVDPNENRTRVDFAPIGLVSTVWVMGKENQGQGDVAMPSIRFEYDLRAFFESKRRKAGPLEPIFVHAVRRTHHDSENNAGAQIESREYSDGFGRVLQSRTQAEAVRFGHAILGGGEVVLPARQSDGRGDPVRGIAVRDNVVVSGRQRYDNKGRIVETFEPYFSSGWRYTPPRESADPHEFDFGARVALFYDPRGQVIRRQSADGSEQRIIYGVPLDLDDPTDPDNIAPTPWEAYTYDANDNAGRTHTRASVEYRHHWNTPTSIVIDALGRPGRLVVRNRAMPARAVEPLPTLEEYTTRSTYDIQGNLLRLVDALNRPALTYIYDLSQHNLTTTSIDAGERTVVFDAAGREIERCDSKHARILQSYDILSRPDRVWARNGAGEQMKLRQSSEYGDAGRPDQPQNERTAARAANLLGKLTRQLDEAGEVRFTAYDFKGNVREKTRVVIADAPIVAAMDAVGGPARRFVVDWGNPPALEGSYEISTTFDALNRLETMQYPLDVGGARKTLRPLYNRAGSLERVTLDDVPFVERIAYNAKGQRTLIVYGNGVMTRQVYDPRTFRLARLRTERYTPGPAMSYQPQGEPLQDFAYTYDLAGNIVTLTERTPGCGVRNNPDAARFPDLAGALAAGDALVRRFEHDPLYRLTLATGREANDIPTNRRPWEDIARDGLDWGRPGTPSPDTARDVTRTYTETYGYDAADNLVTVGHGTWTRQFGMGSTPRDWAQVWPTHLDPTTPWPAVSRNRLTHLGDNQPDVPQTHFFDDNGNLVRENTERHFAWDAADRLAAFAVRAGVGPASVEACYLYDSAGQRVKKIVRRGATIETTVYVDAVFEHHLVDASANNTLHVMDSQQRLATVRVGAALQNDTGPAVQYYLGDHSGSAHTVIGGLDASARAFVNREEFFPYGETSFGSFGRKRYRWTGRERDEESSLHYHGVRFYASHLARWTSCDPSGGVDGPNLYRSMRSNPTKYSDWGGRLPDVNGTPPTPQENASTPAATVPVPNEGGGFTDVPKNGEERDTAAGVRVKVPFPNNNTVVRKTNGQGKTVDPFPETKGFKATDPNSRIPPSTHAMNEHGGKSPYIATSERPLGVPNYEGERYWIDLDKTREAGGEYISPDQVKADLDARVKEGTLDPKRAADYKTANEKEGFIKGKVPPNAVESGPTRAVKGFGAALFVYGAYNSADNMCIAYQESQRTGSARPLIHQAAREVGGWGGALAGAEAAGMAGVALGFESGPGAIAFGLVSGLLGGTLGYFGMDIAITPPDYPEYYLEAELPRP